MQSLEELAMNRVAVLHMCEAASDMSLCRLQRCFCLAAAELRHPR